MSCAGAVRYGELARALDAEGLALHNLASLPHIAVAGAVATATHGSGERNGNLATAVAGLELLTSEGELVELARGDADFAGCVVGLGALGAVTRVTLDVEPAYAVRQRVFEGLGWDALEAHLDAIMAAGDSVSVFTAWGDVAGQVWVKSRVTDAPEDARPELFGAVAATRRAPSDPRPRSRQLHRPARPARPVVGPAAALPHGLHPERRRGDPVRVPRPAPARAAAIAAVRALAPALRPVLQVSELRVVAADDLWLSPQHGTPTLAIHFTWRREPEAVGAVLGELEAALAPFAPRPHWGKLFQAGADAIAPRYPRAADFAALAARLDPRGAFRNAWLDRALLDAA